MSRAASLPTSADLAVWRNLVRRVDQALAGTLAEGDLARAVDRARKAVGLPPVTRDAPCFLLLRAAQAWLPAAPCARDAMAEELQHLANAVRGQLDGGAAPSPASRFRADLDG